MSFLFFGIPVKAEAPTTPVAQQLQVKTDWVAYATEQALEAGISPSKVLSVIKRLQDSGVDPELARFVWEHEGNGNQFAEGDLNIICKRTGKPVRARGVWQITECYHPEVSDECAFNVECATKIVTPWLLNKRICLSQFSTCRSYYSE